MAAQIKQASRMITVALREAAVIDVVCIELDCLLEMVPDADFIEIRVAKISDDREDT